MSDFLTALRVAAHWLTVPLFYGLIGVGVVLIAYLLVANARDRRNPFAVRPDVQADRDAHQERAWGEQS